MAEHRSGSSSFPWRGRLCLGAYSCCIALGTTGVEDRHWVVSSTRDPQQEGGRKLRTGRKLWNSVSVLQHCTDQAVHKAPVLWQVGYPRGQTLFGCSLEKGLRRLCSPCPTPPLPRRECITWTPCPQNTSTGASIISEERVLTAKQYK